ncbi:hypothetical protein SH601_14355 [Gracilibacillus sp. S3-1-1]|uniref:Uncharacterized protein n=1 Tax=Gracilibacillus pellucidus TaxID=3095368 RepID=A0ACC6M854_9BACI|nr:hypothetical protein [Gracilibacillus sp. S3-1-1]MDX8047170.1 hypothetical protein [Gracilibacillus sp. S3-1-1]
MEKDLPNLKKSLSSIEFSEASYEKVLQKVEQQHVPHQIKKRWRVAVNFSLLIVSLGILFLAVWSGVMEPTMPVAKNAAVSTISFGEKKLRSNISDESITYIPSEQEVAELDIPKQIADILEDNPNFNDNQSVSYTVTEDSTVKDTRAHYHSYPEIFVAEAVYKKNFTISEITEEVESWFLPHQSMEELTIQGEKAILHEVDDICELHIITTNKLYTVAGADRETVLKIADKIDF